MEFKINSKRGASMSVGNFLNEIVIFADLDKFAPEIQKHIANSEVIPMKQENKEEGIVYLGFMVTLSPKSELIYVLMPYIRNEAGELAIKEKEWTVKNQMRSTSQSGLKSLGDAIDYINGQM